MIESINVRFFIVCNNEADEIDLAEITESCFLEYAKESEMEYGRCTVSNNGVRQVELTLTPCFGLPELCDLETIN